MTENKSSSLKNTPPEERPREKALQNGIETLSTSELLAILLGCGSRGYSALTLARMLITHFENLRKLGMATLSELTIIPGIGLVKAIEIKACMEMARRFYQVSLYRGEFLENSHKVFHHFHELLRDEKREKFYTVLLDSKHRVIKKELISIGSLNSSIVHPREIFSTAIREAAHNILMIHNHPSGDPSPSKEDIVITKRLIVVGKIIGIEILDHIIIGHNCYTSFVEQSLM